MINITMEPNKEGRYWDVARLEYIVNTTYANIYALNLLWCPFRAGHPRTV